MFVEANGHRNSQFIYEMDGPADFKLPHCSHNDTISEGTVEEAVAMMQSELEPIFMQMSPGPAAALNEAGEMGEGPGFSKPLFRIVLLKLPEVDGVKHFAYNVMMSHIIADGAHSAAV